MKTKPFLICALALAMIALVACAAPTPMTVAVSPTPLPPTSMPPTPLPPTPTAIPPMPTQTLVPPTPTADAIMTLTASRTLSGIELGALAPDFTLTDTAGKSVNLAEEVAKHRSVVVFYYYSEG